jgi:hypothetical protein
MNARHHRLRSDAERARERRGKVIRVGPQVSEVRYNDGAVRTVPNDHLPTVEAVGDELDNPTDGPILGEHAAIRRGQEAWNRLRGDSTWADWIDVGRAHVLGRAAAMRDAHTNKPKGRGYNAAFAAWAKKFGFADLDKGDCSRLFDVMDHLDEINAWLQKLPQNERMRLSHPSSIWRRWKAATTEQTSEKKTSPVQKLKDSLINLQEENDRIKREIERGGGDLWSSDDRPQDIAWVILGKLSKTKAEKVAREILKALKEAKS